MTKSKRLEARKCCSVGKIGLVEALRFCRLSPAGSPERHGCYRHAARESGLKAKECLFA